MIPLQLKLQDFMSYAELDLDLRGIHSAVLSGSNGAGKSTLLDAITYALFDRARAGGEELIRLGQAEMWVELQFEMDGQTYRVWRRRTRKKGVQSQLNFQQLGESGEFVSLDGTTLRETQARIHGVLRMGYETFVNSAFILQGRADQFTTKTPRERKALLGDILGLQQYDDLTTRARERWKAAQARADALEGEQAEVRSALEARAETTESLGRAREAATSLGRLLDQSQERHNRLLAEESSLVAARSDLNAAEAARRQALDEQARLAEEIAAHEAQMTAAREEVAQAAEIEAAHQEYQALLAEDQLHRRRAEALHAVERRLSGAQQEAREAQHAHELALQSLEAELAALGREREQHQAIADDRERIEQARAQLAEARQAEADYLERAQRHRKLEEHRLSIDQAVQRATLAHEAARRDRELRLARAREASAKGPEVAAQVEATQAELKTLANAAVEQDRVKEKGFAFRAAKERAEAAIETALGAKRSLEAKLAQLAVNLEIHAGGRQDVRIDRSHACPLCQTELEAEQLGAVVAQYRLDIQGYADEAARHEHEVAAAERDLLASRARYKELARELERREPTQERLGELRQRLTVLEAARVEAETLAAELARDVEPVLPPELAAERAAAEAAVKALAHDPAALAVLQARVSELRWAEARGWQLEQALTALETLNARLPGLTQALHERRERQATEAGTWATTLAGLVAERDAVGHDAGAMARVQARLDKIADAPARWTALQQRLLWLESAATLQARLETERTQQALRATEQELAIAGHRRKLERQPQWESEIAAAAIELERLRSESTRRHEEVGKLEAELARLDLLDERLAAKKAEWESAIDEAQTYKELSEAFGKNGIQALIIENALPELEEEANRLLARITENRMHVRLATQKEKKTGGVGETLEIYISDEVGTRNYEMYSGGEAFRVNFALRLALSRLLARRAGARLQTLVIDEGFGTQDEKGRERLIEAINAVSGEFVRILVITHVRELKDAFNTHIEVSKRGGVSEVKLSA